MTEDTTTTDPTITSAATEALAEARSRRDRLQSRTRKLEAEALAGRLSAPALADHRAEVDLAEAILAAAERAAADEQGRLADPDTIRAALDEFRTDPTVSTEQLDTALRTLSAAAAAVQATADRRNAAVGQWRERFLQLGMPERGFSIDGNPVFLSGRGDAAKVTIGGQGVTATGYIDRFIAGVIPTAARRAQPLEITTVRHDDTRTSISSHAEVRLLREAGGKAEGTVLSTRDGYTLKSMRTLVSHGVAELLSGELPEPSVSDLSAEATRDAQADRLAAAADDRA